MFLRGVISFAAGEEGGWMKGRDAGEGGRREAKQGYDDSGAHCGVRQIQGSKSDYQLVSEARLRYSLAFKATFYFRCETMTPLHGPTQAPEGLANSSPGAQHPETTQHSEVQDHRTPMQHHINTERSL